MTLSSGIRNFCIVAHIDHGKSTLADRLLEHTATIEARRMVAQALDSMDLERERGVTIKSSAVRMAYDAPDGRRYVMNLIDTPGHVDFSYEVSRALQACEGALLVVDASQGVEAQTLANLHLAQGAGLRIVPVVNKIDLPSARTEDVTKEVADLLAVRPSDVLKVSAKAGINTDAVLETVVARVPPPSGDVRAPLRALVFDSHYDPHKGVVVYVRVVDGRVTPGSNLRMMATGQAFVPLEIGVFAPQMQSILELTAGEVGYIATGFKAVRDAQVGDTVTLASGGSREALPGYQPAKPMVYAGLYPVAGEDFLLLRDALEKLRLNDAALVMEPESSAALGLGFRCGFLGLFHMEIVQERLEREYGIALLATAPSVAYQVLMAGGEVREVDNPAELPDTSEIAEINEPWMRVVVWAPDSFIGAVMDVVTGRRGEFEDMAYIGDGRVSLTYRVPLGEMITELFDQLKSRTRGYASMDYQLDRYRPGDLVRLDILVNGEPVDALSLIVHRDKAYQVGAALTRRLVEVIPRQLFKVPIQAAIGNRIVARETIPALRKDVLAKCYGGDVTRKRKLLERQKAGKKRMKRLGNVEIPQEAFLAVLRLDGGRKPSS